MSKLRKLLVFAGEMILVGICLIGVGVGLSGSISKDTKIKIDLTEQEYEIPDADNIKGFEIMFTSEDIEFIPTEKESITIKYIDNEEDPIYEVNEKNGIVRMKKKDINSFNGGFQVLDIARYVAKEDRVVKGGVVPVKIYVPKNYSGTYNIESVSGSISMESVISNTDFVLSTTSGNIKVKGATVDGGVSISSVSGEVEISDINAKDSIIASTTSGNVIQNNINTDNDINVSTISGRISCKDICVKNVIADSTSGDIDIINVETDDGLNIDTISGEVNIDINDVSDDFGVNIDTISGSVSCEKGIDKNADKQIVISTTSGSVNVSFE